MIFIPYDVLRSFLGISKPLSSNEIIVLIILVCRNYRSNNFKEVGF